MKTIKYVTCVHLHNLCNDTQIMQGAFRRSQRYAIKDKTGEKLGNDHKNLLGGGGGRRG